MDFSVFTTTYQANTRPLEDSMGRVDRLLADQERRAQETARRVSDALAGGGARGGGQSRAADSHIKAFRELEREAQRAAQASGRVAQQEAREIARIHAEKVRMAERAARQRVREEARAAADVARINAQTTRQAQANDRLLEQSARTLANVKTREARRTADNFLRELDRTRRADAQTSQGGGFDSLSLVGGGRLAALRGGGAAGAAAGAAAISFGALATSYLTAARAGVSYDETIARLTKSFESLTGSQAEARQHLEDLRQFAARTPFEFEEVARASQRFQNMGIAAKEVVPLLTAVGNAVASAGGGSEQIARVTLAISQMSAKGKVSAEEMNQLAEAGVGGWKLLEEQTGKTKAELFKAAEAGELSAETFIRAFRAAYGSGNQMQKQMETLTGATSTLKDEGKKALGEAFQPLHRLLTVTAVEMAKTTTEGFSLARSFGAAREASYELFRFLNPALKDLNQETYEMAARWGPVGFLQAFFFGERRGKGLAERVEAEAKQAVDSLRAAMDKAGTGRIFPGRGLREGEQQKIEEEISRAEEAFNKSARAATTAWIEEQEKREAERGKELEKLKEFAKEWDFTITSTIGGRHNRGSLHALGQAIDVRTRDKTDAEIRRFMEAAEAAGFGVRDERVRPPGQRVWSGPHLHLELASKAAQAAARESREEAERLGRAVEDLAEKARRRALADAQRSTQLRLQIGAEIDALREEETTLGRVNKLLAPAEAIGAVSKLTAEHLRHLAALKDIEKTAANVADILRDMQPPTGLIPLAESPEGGPVVDFRTLGTPPRSVHDDLVRHRERMREVADDISSIFRDMWDSIGQEGESMWRRVADTARSIAGDVTQELFRSGLTQILTGERPDESTGPGGIAGAIAQSLGLYSSKTDEQLQATQDLIDALNANTAAQGGTPSAASGLLNTVSDFAGFFTGNSAEQSSGRLNTYNDFFGFFGGGPTPAVGTSDKGGLNAQQIGAQGDVRLIVAIGAPQIQSAVETHHRGAPGKRVQYQNAMYLRKTGKVVA